MINWNDKYSVNISLIDEQHKKLFELLNKANLVKESSNNPNDVLAILDQITEYTLEHFEIEECYMKEFNFPGFESHRKEHIDITNTIIYYKNRAVGGDYKLINEIIKYLMKWIVNHIQVVDHEYIDCFKKNGL